MEQFTATQVVAWIGLLGLAWLCYIAPAIVAGLRGHRQWKSITALNLLFGWSMLGWGAALVWALSSEPAK